MTIISAPTATSGPLGLSDISGYTAFLQEVAHAQGGADLVLDLKFVLHTGRPTRAIPAPAALGGTF